MGSCASSTNADPASSPRSFVSADAVFDALEGDATLLLRASWLKTQDGASCRLIRRGDPLPAEATITATNRDGTFDLEVENVGIVENVSKVRRTKKEFVATFTQ